MVKDDWMTVERNPFVSHALMLVYTQFAVECTRYLFKNNTIVSLLRPVVYNPRRYEEPALIPESALALYRNIILDCAPECWNTDWFEKATHGLQRLVDAKSNIESLTLRFTPRRAGFSSTARGLENNPITCADFLWYEEEFMKAVRALAPRTLTVIIKKENRVKLGIKIDIENFKNSETRDNVFSMTQESLRIMRDKVVVADAKLMGLEGLYKEIFENHKKVVDEGRCELLDEIALGVKGLDLAKPQTQTANQKPCFRLGSGIGKIGNLALL